MGIKHIDEDFKKESDIAKHYFNIGYIDIDKIATNGLTILPSYNIPCFDKPTKALYRGWMLSKERYSILYNHLKSEHNIVLINDPEQYSTMHYFPNAYDSIKEFTPLAIFKPLKDLEELLTISKNRFENKPVFLKDYVKSESAYLEATFVKDGGDTNDLRRAIDKLIELRGKELNIGIVIKEQIEIAKNHEQEDIEYRAFIINGKLIGLFNRFDNSNIVQMIDIPSLIEFVADAKQELYALSNFFTVDFVLKCDGHFCVMEVGDGQVSGIPEYKSSFEFFYNRTVLDLKLPISNCDRLLYIFVYYHILYFIDEKTWIKKNIHYINLSIALSAAQISLLKTISNQNVVTIAGLYITLILQLQLLL